MKTFKCHSIVLSFESYASRIKVLSSKFRIYVQITISHVILVEIKMKCFLKRLL